MDVVFAYYENLNLDKEMVLLKETDQKFLDYILFKINNLLGELNNHICENICQDRCYVTDTIPYHIITKDFQILKLNSYYRKTIHLVCEANGLMSQTYSQKYDFDKYYKSVIIGRRLKLSINNKKHKNALYNSRRSKTKKSKDKYRPRLNNVFESKYDIFYKKLYYFPKDIGNIVINYL